MRIEIAKRADGTGVLRCTRDDGSITWQKQERHGAHFALHDLTHFAVETSLGYQRGFFGLIAEGWDIADTSGRGPRGPLPDQAFEVERIVGVFDSERASSVLWTAEEFNEFGPRALSNTEIAKVRAARAALFKKWSEVSPGQTLNLEFHAPSKVRA
ncbi:MAG TPA: hypothetical protein VGR97_13155 [Candidatus Acidoferrales bacterium]|nr:hypothetical protein [Candidatus Acidoferrales bacterium]